mmetsp:Transcript_10849/g.29936  ORF Transcript_10849/g.29936 Transcript_10849/m.29936 type:complete len:155 (-) Transcript_10849:1307-1771(-)|eukprot:CAMPEP_0198113956 /NCGR_PEP_ID=MMETSP1442-20131203/5488_1 /TAXON_ID= /ORGANISM="Craspedostauros australis, Strain CCMP3328" /LENGTH=154 /DNA_ID=CAMNT_0043771165 /DNA_START=430 /DNA_END=894 /DNA_ORIENTATION=-
MISRQNILALLFLCLSVFASTTTALVAPSPIRRTAAATSTTLAATALQRPAASTVLERSQQKQRRNDSNEQRVGGDAWEVRIYNDGLNTREYVARSLVKVVGISELTAYQTMMQAHKNGIAAVGRWAFEVAELYHDGLQKNGIVSDLVPVDESS